jgi:hypothetical protein
MSKVFELKILLANDLILEEGERGKERGLYSAKLFLITLGVKINNNFQNSR